MQYCKHYLLHGLAIFVAAGIVFASSIAGAEPSKAKLVYRDKYDIVYTAPDTQVDKQAFDAEMRKLNPFGRKKDKPSDGEVQPMYIAYLEGSNSRSITPPGGSTSSISSYYNDTLDYNLCCRGSVTGDSHTRWYGLNPYNADTVSLADTFTFRGVSVSLSAGSGGWSISGGASEKKATWKASLNNNWRIDHYYSGLTFNGFELWASHDATGEFKFGYAWYTINAYDSTWL